MHLSELANLIVGVQETFNPDDLIAISAQPDTVLIRSYFVSPQTNVSLLNDYTDAEIEPLFANCRSLTDATTKVAHLYASKPLNADEAALTEELVLRAAMDAAYEIAANRRLDGSHVGLQSILSQVVTHTQKYVGTFKP